MSLLLLDDMLCVSIKATVVLYSLFSRGDEHNAARML